MTSRDFCYWLQGYFEIHGNRPVQEPESTYGLNESQIQMIRNHLDMVFLHEIDPSYGDKKKQDELNNLHNNNSTVFPGLVNPILGPNASFPPKIRC